MTTGINYEGLLAETSLKPLKREDIETTVLAGIFLLNFFLASYVNESASRSRTFTYFLRSAPTITRARLSHKLGRTLETTFIFVAKAELNPIKIDALRLACRTTQRVLAETISSAFLEKRTLAAARRAAAAAILARNMSHNIGSHVIPRARVAQIVERIQEMRNDPRHCLSAKHVLPIAEKLKTQLDDYIRQKSDFLAELTTEPLSSTSTAMVYRDVVLPMLKNTVLMDCIASNEGFRYRNWNDSPLQLRFFSELGGRQCEVTLESFEGDDLQTLPYGHRMQPCAEDEMSIRIKGSGDTGDDTDVAVALPGALGQFAFYGIIENLIRNAAKHNRKTFGQDSDQRLILTLRLKEDDDDPSAYRMLIYDNVSDPLQLIPSNHVSEDAAAPKKEKLHQMLQAALEEDIIETTGEVRRRAWGLAEIMICANLLSGFASYSYRRTSIRVYTLPEESLGETKTHLGQRLVFDLKLLRARQALLCGSELVKRFRGLQEGDDSGNAAWAKYGIVGRDGAKGLRSYLTSPGESPAAFQFVVLDEAVAADLLRDKSNAPPPDTQPIRAQLPFRIIRVGSIDRVTEEGDVEVSNLGLGEGQLNPTPADVDRILHALWRTWCRRWSDLANEGDQPVRGMVAVHLADVSNPWNTHARAFSQNEEKLPASSRLLLRVTPQKPKSPAMGAGENLHAAIFDRHGGATTNLSFKQENSSYVAFDKQNDDFLSIYEPRFPLDEKSGNWSFPYELFEAGQLRVLILDERLAERSLAPVNLDETLKYLPRYVPPFHAQMPLMPCMWHVAYVARTYIATHLFFSKPRTASRLDPEELAEGALHSPSYLKRGVNYLNAHSLQPPVACPRLEFHLYGQRARLMGYTLGPREADINGYPSIDISNVDILVIHQGILDPALSKTRGDYKPLLDIIQPMAKWVVIESGRGVPPEVQKSNEKFLPFSALDRCFGNARIAKLRLCKQLMERARRKSDVT